MIGGFLPQVFFFREWTKDVRIVSDELCVCALYIWSMCVLCISIEGVRCLGNTQFFHRVPLSNELAFCLRFYSVFISSNYDQNTFVLPETRLAIQFQGAFWVLHMQIA